MGKRGSGSGMTTGGSRDGVIGNDRPIEIETTYHPRARAFRDEVLEATTDGAGNLLFTYAKGTYGKPLSKSQTPVTYKVTAGAVNGRIFNVNLDKAKTVESTSREMSYTLRKAGFKFNWDDKKWHKK